LSQIASYAKSAISGVGSVIEYAKDNAGTLATIGKFASGFM
jgi:hypothetical protein